MSIMPIYDLDDNKNELFGFLYLKDIMYFLQTETFFPLTTRLRNFFKNSTKE